MLYRNLKNIIHVKIPSNVHVLNKIYKEELATISTEGCNALMKAIRNGYGHEMLYATIY